MKGEVSDRALFGWLAIAGLVGVLAGIPVTLAVLQDPAAGRPIDPQRLWMQVAAEVLFLAAAAAVGVWLGKRVGLGPWPLVRAAAGHDDRESVMPVRAMLVIATKFGVVLSLPNVVAVLALPRDALGPGLWNPTALEWAMRALSAALTEEIGFRLGLMTLFVFVLRTWNFKPVSESVSVWTGNVLVSLIFAGAHLPWLLISGTPDWGMVFTVALLNFLGGLALGWLYWRYGILSAFLAHLLAGLLSVTVRVLSGSL